MEPILQLGRTLYHAGFHDEGATLFGGDPGTMMLICLWLTVFGAVWGSFADCAVSRWASGERIFAGRSHCTSCGHALGIIDLIPVLGWLLRRGRCHYCGEKIPAECLVAELAGAAGFLCIAIGFGYKAELGIWYFFYAGKTGLLFTAFELVKWMIFWAMLLTLSLADWAKRIIPDILLVVLAVSRVIWFFVLKENVSVAIDAAWALIVPAALLVMVLLTEKLMGREVMGGGDIKLMFALALYLTWPKLLLTLLVGCLTGLLFAVLSGKKRGTTLPFGPFLTVGALLAACFGDPLVEWYFALF